jgi:hypothetical protein
MAEPADCGLRGIIVSAQPDFLETYLSEPSVKFMPELTWEVASFTLEEG